MLIYFEMLLLYDRREGLIEIFLSCSSMFLLSDSVTRANILSPWKSPRRLIRFMICIGVRWSASVIWAHSNVVREPALLSQTGLIFPASNAITQQEL